MEQIKTPARLVLVLILLCLLNFACTPSPKDSSVTEVGLTQTGVQNQNNVTGGYYVDEIKSMAATSTCASYSWASRGRAPAGYMKGMALTFGKSFCRLRASEATSNGLVDLLTQSSGSSSSDALALYGDSSKSKEEVLRFLYTLGIGLGMRESSGKYCEGRDMSASNTSASTAEAGMFQTSYNSMSASVELSKLFAEFQADTSKCFFDVFKIGVSCSSSSNSIAGIGVGATYQSLNRSCPAFAAEYAMVMLRVRRNHYGPINRQEAEVVPACNQMLKSVQEFIDNDPNACSDLL